MDMNARRYGNGGLSQDDSFRRTFGHQSDLAPMGSALQFLRVSLFNLECIDPDSRIPTHGSELVQLMFDEGLSR